MVRYGRPRFSGPLAPPGHDAQLHMRRGKSPNTPFRRGRAAVADRPCVCHGEMTLVGRSTSAMGRGAPWFTDTLVMMPRSVKCARRPTSGRYWEGGRASPTSPGPANRRENIPPYDAAIRTQSARRISRWRHWFFSAPSSRIGRYFLTRGAKRMDFPHVGQVAKSRRNSLAPTHRRNKKYIPQMVSPLDGPPSRTHRPIVGATRPCGVSAKL